MPEISDSNTAAAIVEDLRQTLVGTTVGGAVVFTEVAVFDDAEEFLRTIDPLAGDTAAVVFDVPDKERSADNAFDWVYRLAGHVVFRFSMLTDAGGGDQTPLTEMNRLAGVVRKALLADTSRGGNAALIEWAGGILDGTEITGPPRLLGREPNQSFYAAALPVAVGWGE